MSKKLFLLFILLILTFGCSSETDSKEVEVDVSVKVAVAPTSTSLAEEKISTPVPTSIPKTEPSASISKDESKQKDDFGAGGLVKDLKFWQDTKLPNFIEASHIEIADIAHVSKFRSSAGHDFSDSFESCCSMKHYFIPIDYYGSRFTQSIFSPVDGIVLYLSEPSGGNADDWKIDYEEQTGKKPPVDYRDWNIYIRPDSAPNIWITHMHVNPIDEIIKKVPPTNGKSMMMGLSRPAPEGYRVKAGDLIAHGLGEIIVKRHLDGNGIPSGCNSADVRDNLVKRNLPGCKSNVQLHSIFEFMTDDVFNEYEKVADVSRSDFIITADDRAKSPLTCEGEFFTESGNADDPATYVKLQESSSISNMASSESSNTSIAKEVLPDISTLTSNRELIASFEGSGSQALSGFQTDNPYVLVIAATGGPITVWVDNGSDKRSIYSRPSSNGIDTYETNKLESGYIEISVETQDSIDWRIVTIQ